MAPGYPHFLAGVAITLGLAACSSLPYAPRPLDVDASAAEFLDRSAQVDGLRRFAEANGYAAQAWPPQQWDLPELTLVALYFHADIRIARSRAQVAHAALGGVSQAEPWSARFKPEYHSHPFPDTDGPWTLGLELEIPLVAQGKRAAQAERSAFLADAADLDVANAAWRVRGRVRDHYLELQASREALASLDALLAARQEMLGLVSRRVEAGMLSARELTLERSAHSQLEQMRNLELTRQQRAHAELAAALGLPPEVVERMALRLDVKAPAALDLDAGALRRMAVRNRLDVHRKLLEFGAADAEVKAAVAAQNPGITLGPGYAWDQGDNLWSLAVGVSIPPAVRTRASILEARARRELAAEEFAATQSEVIGRAASAGAQYRLAGERLAIAERQLELQRDHEARTRRQFDTGAADRMQRLAAHIETLTAQSALQAALVAQRQALVQLEDAMQRPLLGDFAMPPVRENRAAETGNAIAIGSRPATQPASKQ